MTDEDLDRLAELEDIDDLDEDETDELNSLREARRQENAQRKHMTKWNKARTVYRVTRPRKIERQKDGADWQPIYRAEDIEMVDTIETLYLLDVTSAQNYLETERDTVDMVDRLTVTCAVRATSEGAYIPVDTGGLTQ